MAEQIAPTFSATRWTEFIATALLATHWTRAAICVLILWGRPEPSGNGRIERVRSVYANLDFMAPFLLVRSAGVPGDTVVSRTGSSGDGSFDRQSRFWRGATSRRSRNADQADILDMLTETACRSKTGVLSEISVADIVPDVLVTPSRDDGWAIELNAAPRAAYR